MQQRIALTLAVLLTVLPAASFAQTNAPPPQNEGTTAIITGQGTVSRAPDTATISVSLQTNDAVSTTATSKNNAAFAALTSALGALHVEPADIKTTYYNVSFNPGPMPTPIAAGAIVQPAYPYPGPQRYGYNVNRQVSITVSQVRDIGAVVDAAVKSGVTAVNGVQYGLKDRAPANEAALALALADAANQAKVVASATHMRLAGIKQIQAGQQYNAPYPPPVRIMSPNGIGGVPTDIAPAAVEVRASVTVTYYLKP
jgi:uncharacterized protein YggE